MNPRASIRRLVINVGLVAVVLGAGIVLPNGDNGSTRRS